MAKVINIMGSGSNVGKTELMVSLIERFKQKGLSVATIKHDVHGFDLDQEGKDTYRHRNAGADTVIISSKSRLAIMEERKEEATIEELLTLVKDKDIVLVEGYKRSSLKKVEVYRKGFSEGIIATNEQLLAVVSDDEVTTTAPVFGWNSISELACYLLENTI